MKKRPHNQGAILIISLWVLALLSILAVGLAYRLSLELRLADYDLGRLNLFYLAQAGLRQASALLLQDDAEIDSLRDAWAESSDPDQPTPFGEGTFFLVIEDEFSRPNLNVADSETLLRIPGMEESVVLSLRAWRGDQDLSPSQLDQEEAYYRSLNRPIERERKPFQSLEELTLVRGMTPSLYETLQARFTVYGPGKINLNTVSRETWVFLGLEDSLARAILLYRTGEDGEEGTEDDHLFHTVSDLTDETLLETLGLSTDQRLALVNFVTKYQGILTVQSNHFRVRCKAVSKNGITKEVVAVLQRVPEGLPVIKYWHED